MERYEYQDLLEGEYLKRLSKNSVYSKRSFATFLGISSSALSELLSGKRKISLNKAHQLLEKLELTYDQRVQFINSVKMTKARYKKSKIKRVVSANYHQLTADTFNVISDWFHFAILNLINLPCFKNDPEWIAKKLSISPTEAKLAVERLFRLELLKFENGVVVRTTNRLKTTDDIPSSALRKFHRQNINKAITSLENDDVKERDITSMTMAIDSKNIEKAKEKIKKFRREMSDLLEAGSPDRIYNINIQLVPMDGKE